MAACSIQDETMGGPQFATAGRSYCELFGDQQQQHLVADYFLPTFQVEIYEAYLREQQQYRHYQQQKYGVNNQNHPCYSYNSYYRTGSRVAATPPPTTAPSTAFASDDDGDINNINPRGSSGSTTSSTATITTDNTSTAATTPSLSSGLIRPVPIKVSTLR